MLYELIDDLLEHILERTGMTFKDEPKVKEISRRLKEADKVKRNIPRIYELIAENKFGRIDYYCENDTSPFLTEYRKETKLEG